MRRAEPRGQMLVVFAVLIVVLLGFAGVAIDVGRVTAERRHAQAAADAGALAACRALIAGETDTVAATAAQQVTLTNLENSPAGASAVIASPPSYEDLDGSGGVDADELVSGIVVAGTTVRVAVDSSVDTMLAQVVGIETLDTGARARCDLQGGPAVPIVARRYVNPQGPGSGFVDHLATAASSTSGVVDTTNPRGYDVRTPASEAAPGPQFAIYGPSSKAHNDSSFRGFVALDIRNFESASSRMYYNAVTAGMTDSTIKDVEGAYLVTGYPGPAFPPVSTPPTGSTQVAVLSGNDTSFVPAQFNDTFRAGDRLMLAVYDSTVMEIPDFAISPPVEITLPSTTVTPYDGPTTTISRNDDFHSTVTLSLRGDAGSAAAGHPEYDILPDPPVTPPAAEDMSEPIWSTNVFEPAKNGTPVSLSDMQSNAIPPGIYTVWVEGESGNPYYQRRQVPVPVRVQTDGNNDGDYNDAVDVKVTRDFSLDNSVLDGSTATLGGTITLPLRVSTGNGTANWGSGPATETNVAISWDTDTLTSCSLTPASLGMGTIGFSSASATPTTGTGTAVTLTINTAGLTQGCYLFTIRGHGVNSNGQPVTHLETVRFTVATTASSGQYVDIIGFAVFQIDAVGTNDIVGHAVTGISANPNDPTLRRAQRARLVPWS
jgi:Flp pilus assembly protein TadG